MHKIEVRLKSHLADTRGLGLVKDIEDLGITTVSAVRIVNIFRIDANLTPETLELIGHSLLSDPITQEYRLDSSFNITDSLDDNHHIVEVTYNAGVADPVEETVMKAVTDLGIIGVKMVKTAHRYVLEGQLNRDQLKSISNRLLINPIIQHALEDEPFDFPESPKYDFKLNHFAILEQDTAKLSAIGQEFGFNDDELLSIIAYFRQEGRNPSDAELETLAQTWSEHCGHKTFKSKISFNGKIIDNLLKSTIIRATEELNKPWCLSVFEDNAGVIDFDGQWALCFKVETHNHPSAVEPYGGAATGIGGVVRDPLGTGLGAKPILNTDVFCFAPPDLPYEKLPKGVLHPRRIFKGVRAGVADYANRLGIPTLNGAILFDERYMANPLVFCGTLGLIPTELSFPGRQKPGDLVVVVGGKTGRDGVRGVTFASEQLNEESSAVSYNSVQIGNAIVEKKIIDVLLQARDRRLYRRITDCGGGGLSSAVGEMAEETGVRIDLEKVPLKYDGLSYSEIWVSESQERMLLAVPPESIEELIQLFINENVEAAVIGQFSDDQRLQLFYHGTSVCNLTMEFLHHGHPQLVREAVWQQPQHRQPDFTSPANLTVSLKSILSSWNTCSKEWVIRQYDHEVQGGSILKPLVGKNNDGPSDAAIIRPVLNSEMGAIISNGINPEYGKIDPYWMAASAIDETLRQIIAVGGNLRHVALLDNFCWGNTNRPEILGALVRATQACYDMAIVYQTPFISGKDSLHNEFQSDGEIISIPHTLLISAVGVIDDTSRVISMDFKEAGNLVYIVGATGNELGGSVYFKLNGFTGNNVPKVNPQRAKELMDKLSITTKKGLVRACHDCSDGGIGVAIAEMAFAGGLGASIMLKDVPLVEVIDRNDFVLFSESNSRFLAEVAPGNKEEFEKTMSGSAFAVIGEVNGSEILEISGSDGLSLITEPISELKEAWQKPLRW